ncbi:hypothetical protein JOE40_002683 [Arthrobacter sp. PvP102]|jgi:hypothetical protein|uniref:hypothetical protein n=1 Tax=unclassified Arthrobacter TaxID=235627 RepID=UPI001B762CBD|nr:MULTISPECIES: hypothetical protein [unclassified Arthrobacter]MBP1233039.1 hypothetical protein [Arthrobacter sp. PvP103]MBP1238174.1 hypothetical protein [Arthrobacter sp. PvP102]
MGFDHHEPDQRMQLRAALKAVGITPGELWLNYFSIGGSVGEYEVEAYLQGLLSLPPVQRDLLAMAANELIEAVPRLYAPYSNDLRLSDSAPESVESVDPARASGESCEPGQESESAGGHDGHGRSGPDEFTDPSEDG